MMAAAALLMNVGSRADTKLVRLRVQHTVEPQAVDEKEPVFGWAMESDQPGVSQKAYRLTLHTEHGDTLMWDSGKVTDASSTGVTYKGQPLKPLTGYRWTLSVWDNKGKEHTGQSAFFTGLMDCRLPAWSGAQWIGSTAQRLSAPSNFSFTINTRFRIERGHQAAILLGANDFRLRDAFQNIDNMQGTSYVRVELDFPEAQSGRVGALRVYRVGFTPTDQDRLPLLEVSEKSFPQSNISSLLTEEGTHEEHELSVCVETGNISFLIDGVALTICGNGFPGHLQPLLDRQGNTAEVVTIGQWGGTHDHNSYPNLCEVDPATGVQYRNIAPGEMGFIWGSNAIGQDLWARIWAGARTSLIIAFFVALIEAVVGITAGVLWGYVRQLDFFFTELYNICDNVPSTIILILISYVASPSIKTLILGMSITGWIEMARFIRNQILIIRDRDYNVASRCIGTPTSRIVLRNLLPYLVSVIMLRMALTIPAAIGSEVFITYIGLGLSVETPSLGNLINDGRKVMMQAGLRYQLLYPTIILSFVTIAFYLIGNAFSDAADPKNHLQ